MTHSYYDLFPPSPTDDSQAIMFGYIRKTTKLPRLRRQIIEVSKSMHEAYDAEKWAIFPTLDCLVRYITELENLHLELDGKRQITREDVGLRIRQVERSAETNEEFSLLMREGCKLPGVAPSMRLALPIDPEIVWSFETDRYQSVLDSWTLHTGDSDPIIKEARDQLKAAAWLDILTNVEEYRDWRCKAPLRPQFMQSLKPSPQALPLGE
ncbi:hypothetical protein BJ322DRAFT_715736 [Thelephora terrestris]|uniref:Uncharacterized protein n=1 Tax=Thelephora terrestris TaxID=56493 RepID=A0A9P6L8Z8_9AGAM|nr:hypothetical protein BJ322DRAFT_715736 [Thelephora terrestris]